MRLAFRPAAGLLELLGRAHRCAFDRRQVPLHALRRDLTFGPVGRVLEARMRMRAIDSEIETRLRGDSAVLRVIVGALDVIERRRKGQRLPVRCAFELKVDEFKPEYLGKLEFSFGECAELYGV